MFRNFFKHKGKEKAPAAYRYYLPGNDILLPDGNYKTQVLKADFTSKKYTCLLGAVNGNPLFCDLSSAPHLLVAGTTGSGKSVCINTIICSLLLKNCPGSLRLVFIDPKRVDYFQFKDLPHTERYETDIDSARRTLADLLETVNNRYDIMQNAGVCHIDNCPGSFPHIVIVFDEYASFSHDKAISNYLSEILRIGRAAGIHVIIGVQRPERSVINGQIKANCPTRICFRVNSAIDSRVALDIKGAETLAGKGDGMHITATGDLYRFHGTMTSPEQMQRIINHWKDGKNRIPV